MEQMRAPRRTERTRKALRQGAARARGIAIAAAFALALPLALAACGSGAQVSESSPHAMPEDASITSSSELTEQTQLVDVCIPFDGELSITGDATQDFEIDLDDEDLNAKTTAVGVEVQGDELHVTLSPTSEAKGVDTPLYFACYLGKLRIAPRSEDGALPHVVGADGTAAVLDSPIEATIPSGMRIQQVDAEPSGATVQVTQFAQIRCCTWLQIGGTELFMHHHRFAQESNQTCAAALAEAICNGSDGLYEAQAEGDQVRIRALDAADAEPLDVRIVEGITGEGDAR